MVDNIVLFHFSNTGDTVMSKSKDSRKETKKKPAQTPKEKKRAKQDKKKE
jgi:hypothetical protein